MNDADEELTWLEKQAELHEDKPALKDLHEQINVIRELTGTRVKKRKYLEGKPSWEQNYWRIAEQHEADANNPQVQAAWEQYYMMKGLLSK